MKKIIFIVLLLIIFSSVTVHGADGNRGKETVSRTGGLSRLAGETTETPHCKCVNGIWYVEGGGDASRCSEAAAAGTGTRLSALPSSALSGNACTEASSAASADETKALDVRWRDAHIISLPAGTEPDSQKSAKIFIPFAGTTGVLGAAAAAETGAGTPVYGPQGVLKDILQGMKTEQETPVPQLYQSDKTGFSIAVGPTTTIIQVHAPPPPPEPVAPGNATTLAMGRVDFIWTEVADVVSYRLQASMNPRFTSTVIDMTTGPPSLHPDRTLPFGVYYWRVRAVDGLNFMSEWSPTWRFMVDSVGPANNTPSNFINNGAAATNNPVVSLAISARKINGVTGYFISEKAPKPALSDAGWEAIPETIAFAADVPFTVSQGDGKKSVHVWFRDKTGNVSAVRTDSIILDTVAPDTSIISKPSLTTNAKSAAFGLKSTERGSTFQCSLDGGPYAFCAGTALYGELADGKHVFQVQATDLAGNIDPTPAGYAWTVDTELPRTAITKQPRIWTNVPSAAFSFTSPKKGVLFQCRFDDGEFAACESPVAYADLADGSHTFAVQATDEAGNVDPEPASYTWTIDTTPFGTSITEQPYNPSHTDAAIFAFSSKKAGVTHQCKIDASTYSACVSHVTYTGLEEGNHSFTVKAVDELGNEELSPAKYSWIVSLPPENTTPSSFINKGGAYFIYKTKVKLTLSATSNKWLRGYFVSESPIRPEPESSGWILFKPIQEFSRVVPYTLSEDRGTKTVYVWFKDIEDNISPVKSDTIYLFNENFVVWTFMLGQIAVVLAL